MLSKIYRGIKNFVFKPACIGLAALVLSSCSGNNSSEQTPKQETEKYQFNNWGHISGMPRKEIEVGDFDGDGDLDIVAIDFGGGMSIYENRIPQKKE